LRTTFSVGGADDLLFVVFFCLSLVSLHPRRYREPGGGRQSVWVQRGARYLDRRRLAVEREYRVVADVLDRRQERGPRVVARRIRK